MANIFINPKPLGHAQAEPVVHIAKPGNLRGGRIHTLESSQSSSHELVPHTCTHITSSQASQRLLDAKCKMIDCSGCLTETLNRELEEQEEEVKANTKKLEEAADARRISMDHLHNWSTVGSIFQSASLVGMVAAGLSASTPLGLAIAGYGALSLGHKVLSGTGMLTHAATALGISKDSKSAKSFEETSNSVISKTDSVAQTAVTALQSLPMLQGLTPANLVQSLTGFVSAGAAQTAGTGYTYLHRAATYAMSFNSVSGIASSLEKCGIGLTRLAGPALIVSLGQAATKVGQNYAVAQVDIHNADITEVEGKISSLNMITDDLIAKIKQIMSRNMRNEEIAAEMFEPMNQAREAVSDRMRI